MSVAAAPTQTITIPQAVQIAVQSLNEGNSPQAQMLCENVLGVEPGNIGALQCLAMACLQQGDIDKAVSASNLAIQADPQNAAVYQTAAAILTALEQHDEAVQAYEKAIASDPKLTDAYINLSNLHMDALGQSDAALEVLKRGVDANPEFFQGYYNMGLLLKHVGRVEEAVEAYDKALSIQADFYPAAYNRGISQRALQRLQPAVESYRQTLAAAPDFVAAHGNLGQVLYDQGKTEEAMACYQTAIEKNPDFKEAYVSRLYTQLFIPGVTLKQVLESHKAWNEKFAAPFQKDWLPFDNERKVGKKLVLGFVSPDFRRHPVGYFTVGILEALAQQNCEIICYANQTTEDVLTDRFKKAAHQWRAIWNESDEAVARQIREDKVDILFDMASYLKNGRMLLFAMKPAPIQVTWAGYMATTGLTGMDYILGDAVEIPQSAEPYYTEKVLRMPSAFVCFDPPADAPKVTPLPAEKNHTLTFGCFNVLSKINATVVATWCQVLKEVEGSQFVLKAKGLDCPDTAQYYRDLFAQNGIEADRLELLGGTSQLEHLEAYAKIDVQLDTFPFSGSTTTLESLYMGVPVLTLKGETFAGRHSASFLTAVDMTSWIADTPEAYVQRAVKAAKNIGKLSKTRKNLRRTMQDSPLCQPKRFATELMNQLQQVWKTYCQAGE